MSILYDGDGDPSRALRSPDNLDWSGDGYIYVQEDRANGSIFAEGENTNEASIVRLDPNVSGGDPLRVAEIDRTSVVPLGVTDGDPGDVGAWESSGILDVSTLFDKEPGEVFVFDVEAHSIGGGVIETEDLVQGGQLNILYGPDAEPFGPPPAGMDELDGVEDVTGTRFSDVIYGDDNDNMLEGAGGEDTLDGRGGDDTLEGGADDNSLIGGEGDDMLSGGEDDDVLEGGADDDRSRRRQWRRYPGRVARTTTNCRGDRGADLLRGGTGDDNLDGGRDDDRLEGGEGDDDLEGGRDDDVLDGGEGDDNLSGGRGDDTLDGGEGDDDLTGGRDADTFVLDLMTGVDVITDFEIGEDMIDVSGFAFADFAGLLDRAEQDGDDVYIELDGDNGDALVLLDIAKGDLEEGDFIFA